MKQWNIGLARVDIAALIHNGNHDIEYKWLPMKASDRFFADPFIFKNEDGNINIIYEDYSYGDQYGKISLTTVDHKFNPVFQKEMLDTQSHLSYPYVFVEAGKTYILPEASKTGVLSCYEYDFERKELVNKMDIIKGLPLLDSTILKHDDKYWLFATKRGEDSNNKLYIYYADQMEGPYTPHAGNPVKNSLNGSRPAGNFIKIDGKIYRPSQNCYEYYGKSVTINKIVLLNKDEFLEEPVLEIRSPKNSRFNYAMHTINLLDDVIVIDGLKRRLMIGTQIKIFIKKLVNGKSASQVLNLCCCGELIL